MPTDRLPSFDEIKKLPPEEAITILDQIIENPTSLPSSQYEEAFVVRGMKYWGLNKRKEAIDDYLAALKINPESRAKTLLDFANSILDFYNKDLLNP